MTAFSTSRLDLILTTIPYHFQSTAAISFGASDSSYCVHTLLCMKYVLGSQSLDHKIVYSRRYSKLNKYMLDDICLVTSGMRFLGLTM